MRVLSAFMAQNPPMPTGTIVASAHKAGVPVIAYDRLITGCDLDLYVSVDPIRVGELQAEYLVKRVPRGRYVLIEGAPTDHNAVLLREGQMKVLKPFLASGAIRLVADQWARDWQPVEALKIMENALTRNANRVDAVLASNDGTAGGAIQALTEQKLAGKVPVTGQDADLAACQRIMEGTQSMTVYKSITREAERAAELAVAMARKAPLGAKTVPLDNGRVKVPSVLLEPAAVDRDNMAGTVIADGFQQVEAVYRNVPRDRWPAR